MLYIIYYIHFNISYKFALFDLFHQIYRVSDMELVRVLPSSEDEVNVACFHPSPGGGLVYGTKVNDPNS